MGPGIFLEYHCEISRMASQGIRRTLIFDKTTDVPLCDIVRLWHEEVTPTKAEGICRLAHSFVQLQRNLGASSLVQASFDFPTPSRLSNPRPVSAFYQMPGQSEVQV
eukprot:c18481_g1_i3.p1 GENE.c18481_g1_i3~~c18481_g1_i3.p1  ORF type:complete len:107 (+),score=13.06 c18481_g1_i3:1-321(+)